MIGQQPDGTYAVEKPKPQIHTTSLNMQCGEAFRRRYMLNEIIPPGVAALVGSATDESVTRNLRSKIESKKLLSLEEVADTARDGLNQAWEQGVHLEPEEAAAGIKKVKGDATDKAVRLSILHAKAKAPEIEPTAVQRKWTIELSGYPMDLVGTLDVQEGSHSIRDTKTTGKTPPEDIAHKSIQLTAYSLAVWKIDGEAPEKVALDYLIDTKTPAAKTFESTRDIDDYETLLARIETVTKAIEKGVFIPVSPDHWMCNPRWCGYFSSCKYVRLPKQFAA
jgi:hypothetical protein